MKKLILAASVMAASAGVWAVDPECNDVGVLVSEEETWEGDDYTVCEIPASITGGNITLAYESDDTGLPVLWQLTGITTVGNGYVQNTSYASADKSVLSIEAGVNVVASNANAALVIARGAKMNAQGTANDPIVFSYLDDDDFSGDDEDYSGEGQWGGVILSGYGVANECTSSDSCLMEGISSNYYFGFGDEPVDEDTTGLTAEEILALKVEQQGNAKYSSGSLSYVVITEGGTEINVNDPDAVANGGDEINGLTLYGVTSATAINNIHVNENYDDGIEFFGGDVAVSDIWLTCNGDDSVDWDYGFHGSITRVYIEQGDKNGAEDHAFELAGNPNNYAATPLATASVEGAYVEFVGDNANADTDFVFKLKEGTDGYFNNIVVTGYTTGTTQDCDAISSTNITSADFGAMTVDCSVVDPTTFSPSGSSSFAKVASFWTAPACN